MRLPGADDLLRAADNLADRLPSELAPFARLAFNYRWSWTPGGHELFRAVDPHRWDLCGHNPVRLLEEASPASLDRASSDSALLDRAEQALDDLRAELIRPAATVPIDPARPVAFLCAEFAVHGSLPVYSGGLGVLAGDILKESSDRALPLVGVGILYRRGYFHQRLDPFGSQQEFWIDSDSDRLPAALVTGADGRPITVRVPIRGRDITVQIWRVDVGRVPLYLLDAERPENARQDRWITARLYVGDRETRLAQYALLGRGGVRALRALGIDPGLLHLNEGHVALAPVELATEEVARGRSLEEAVASAHDRTVFTTHTPVPAGNEAYSAGEVSTILPDLPGCLGTDLEGLMRLGRVRSDDPQEPFGMTPLGLRMSRSANAVSARHGDVARGMWQALYPGVDVGQVPIIHVTNGVHLPTWMADEMRDLLDRHLGPDWHRRASDPAQWARIDRIPDEEVWETRCAMRARLVDYVRDRTVADRLARGEAGGYVTAAAEWFDPDVLTIGFARRVATYKRLHMLVYDPARSLRLLDGDRSLQLVIAGKAHPQDEEAKGIVRSLFTLKMAGRASSRVAFLEDYNLGMAAELVAGCDVWMNLPRKPLEASGTSGMKSALNGGLNLSVLDGWWEEAFDGTNGWGIDSDPGADLGTQDARDAGVMYDLLEREIVPLFYDRDASGVPRGWVRRVKAALRTIGPRFAASRMMDDYLADVYTTGPR